MKNNWPMMVLTGAVVAFLIGGGAVWIDDAVIKDCCDFVETREIIYPWGDGHYDVYHCDGVEWTMPANRG